MLEINEIFGPTIQGEGKKCGTPSIFIRFGKCNLKCEGFGVEYTTPSGIKKCSCDSYYAVDMEFRNEWQKFEKFEDIVNIVEKILPTTYKPDIVITGGEPLLYWNSQEFQKLLKYYIENDFLVTIETNASINIDLNEEYHKKILFSMSVKLSNSKEPIRKRINIDTITKIIKKSSSYLKFVVDSNAKKELLEIKELLNQIPFVEVFLMPKGDTKQEVENNSLAVIELCTKEGFNYSDRLHIRIWDNKRGV